MANQEQLKKLKAGSEEWNAWRRRNSSVDIDLSNADLEETELQNVNLNKANLQGADLTDANLEKADLEDANLKNADLTGATFMKANLSDVDFSGADLDRAIFDGADLYAATFDGANFIKTDFENCDLVGADFSGCSLPKCIFKNAKLKKASFVRADLSDSQIEGAELTEAKLSSANLSGLNFGRVDLSKANLSEANLSGADLSSANLSGAALSGANLSRSNLSRADLANRDLTKLDLSGANLSGANLSGSNLRETNAVSANFAGANLTGACIKDWHINKETNLQGVQVDYVYLEISDERPFTFLERRPRDSSEAFKVGEFLSLFQKAFDTIELIFMDGIDWLAFVQSLQDLRKQLDDETIAIRSIEKAGDSHSLVVQLDVSSKSNKSDADRYIKEFYKHNKVQAEQVYRERFDATAQQISDYRKRNADPGTMIEAFASAQITIINNPNFNNQTFNESIIGNLAALNKGTQNAKQENSSRVIM